ncbi:unnamed protein product, partial [Didymodactylos carnosus]
MEGKTRKITTLSSRSSPTPVPILHHHHVSKRGEQLQDSSFNEQQQQFVSKRRPPPPPPSIEEDDDKPYVEQRQLKYTVKAEPVIFPSESSSLSRQHSSVLHTTNHVQRKQDAITTEIRTFDKEEVNENSNNNNNNSYQPHQYPVDIVVRPHNPNRHSKTTASLPATSVIKHQRYSDLYGQTTTLTMNSDKTPHSYHLTPPLLNNSVTNSSVRRSNDDSRTYSFHEDSNYYVPLNRKYTMQAAKSHGDLSCHNQHPNNGITSRNHSSNNESIMQQRYRSESPPPVLTNMNNSLLTKTLNSNTTTEHNIQDSNISNNNTSKLKNDEKNSSKIPLWKRLKKIIVPKRKERYRPVQQYQQQKSSSEQQIIEQIGANFHLQSDVVYLDQSRNNDQKQTATKEKSLTDKEKAGVISKEATSSTSEIQSFPQQRRTDVIKNVKASKEIKETAASEKSSRKLKGKTVTDGICTTTSKSPFQYPIKVNEIRSWIKQFPEQRIREEYEKLPTEILYPRTVALKPENKLKNRFTAIEAYDHSRVILKPVGNDSSSDYINACYIDGYKTQKMYIAAQGPTEHTMYDFLRMIWQLRIEYVIMATRLFEEGKNKCAQYWPDDGEKKVNDLRIKLESEDKYADYVIRRLSIYMQHDPSNIVTFKQYHFVSWPDHGVLSLTTVILDFRQRFREDYSEKPIDPILVHCSAGIGRTGTFIGLDSLLEMSLEQDTIDVLEFTYLMRQKRVYMIQTVDQYVFLYRALIEGIWTSDTNIPIDFFKKKFKIDTKAQYRLLEQFQSTIELNYQSALDPINISKNRLDTILACDSGRPYLMTQIDKCTDYINAVYVNAYRQAPVYIVTQYPLPTTVVDFWRLIYDHNINIIMLLEMIPRDTNERSKPIRHFQVKDNTCLLPVVKRFLKEMKSRTDNVLLQCLNGLTWCGFFVALCNAIDKMQTEKYVDIFKVVRLIRANRPEFIDQGQYEVLFTSLHEYNQQYLHHLQPS